MRHEPREDRDRHSGDGAGEEAPALARSDAEEPGKVRGHPRTQSRQVAGPAQGRAPAEALAAGQGEGRSDIGAGCRDGQNSLYTSWFARFRSEPAARRTRTMDRCRWE